MTETNDDRRTLLIFVWTLATFKVVTSALVVWFFPSLHALIIVLALSVPWMVGGLYVAAGRSRGRYRLIRARVRRRELIRGEWSLD